MTSSQEAAPLTGGVALLERAIGYIRGVLPLVTPEALGRPTPCRAWDLAALLDHMNDSLLAVGEASGSGRVGLDIPDGVRTGSASHPVPAVAALRERGCRLLAGWTRAEAAGDDPAVSVGDRLLLSSLVAVTGAVEITVHGWDLAQGCGRPRPIPDALAGELLDLAPMLVGEADRGTRFAPAVEVAATAAPGDRLVAFLGRTPD